MKCAGKEKRMKQSEKLRELLREIDHRSYPAYKQLRDSYDFSRYILGIDHVQGDPFAAPSRVSVHIDGKKAGFPEELYDTEEKKTALADHLLRRFGKNLRAYTFQAKGSGKSGLMSVTAPGQEILPRTACEILPADGSVVLRMEIGFPANGRTINSKELEKIFFDYLPQCVEKSLYYRALPEKELKKIAALAEDQTSLRRQMREKGLVAFVANGSVLPRESGVSSRPMKEAVPFRSPESLEVCLDLPNHGEIRGMGIKRGITLIVGGGYHGKSTLLKALEKGIYNHIAGDGREYVASDPDAVKIRAEDGRCVKKTDIRMFINNLPNGKDTKIFETEDASGSTSQAANVAEALEAGASVLLIDEDTSATNFMVRDELMQRVVHQDEEPITPFSCRVRELFDRYGVSTILVAGSCGTFFHEADCIIQMKQYEPEEITAAAKKEAAAFPVCEVAVPPVPEDKESRIPAVVKGGRETGIPAGKEETGRSYRGASGRYSRRGSGENGRADKRERRVKTKTMGMDGVQIGHDTIDLRYVEQLADPEQLKALAVLVPALQQMADGKKTAAMLVDEICEKIRENGFASVCGREVPGNLSMPRKQEIFACLNRYRQWKMM